MKTNIIAISTYEIDDGVDEEELGNLKKLGGVLLSNNCSNAMSSLLPYGIKVVLFARRTKVRGSTRHTLSSFPVKGLKEEKERERNG